MSLKNPGQAAPADSVTPGLVLLADQAAVDAGLAAGSVLTPATFANSGQLADKADTTDTRFPTADEKAALAGTSGTPSAANEYVTDADARLSDARTPSNDADLFHESVDGEIAGLTQKATPVAADKLLIEDSEDSDNKKYCEIGDLPFGTGGGSDPDLVSITDAAFNSGDDLVLMSRNQADATATFQNEVDETAATTLSSPTHSTTQFKFHTSSIKFDGTLNNDDRIRFGNNAAWAMGTTDFYMEFWIRPTAQNTDGSIIASRNYNASNTGLNFGFTSATANPKFRIAGGSGGGLTDVTFNTALPINTWYFVRLNRVSGVCTLYIDGVAEATNASIANIDLGSTGLVFGGLKGNEGFDAGGGHLEAFLDDFVLHVGNAHASPTDVPLAAYDALRVADGGITASKLGSSSVTEAKIASSAVSAAKIASDAVTTAKILDANVTLAKLSSAVQTTLSSLVSPDAITVKTATSRHKYESGDRIVVRAGALPSSSGMINDITGEVGGVQSGPALQSTAQVKFNSSSFLFDATDNYEFLADSLRAIGTGDFFISYWAYPNAKNNGKVLTRRSYTATSGGVSVGFHDGSGGSFARLAFRANDGATETAILSTTDLALNTWHFCVFEKVGSTLNVYANGTLVGTGTLANITNGDAIVDIGRKLGDAAQQFTGHLDDLVWHNGSGYPTPTVVPTTSYVGFTHSTIPEGGVALDTIANNTIVMANVRPELGDGRGIQHQLADSNFASVSLLIQATSEVGDFGRFRDRSSYGHLPVGFNFVRHTTAVSKFNGASIIYPDITFVNEVAGIKVPYHSSLTFGTSDFTMECWINPHNIGQGGNVFTSLNAGATTGWQFYISGGGGTITLYINGASVGTATSCGLTNGSWFHLAFVKNSGTTKIYVNGVDKTSGSFGGTFTSDATEGIFIGNAITRDSGVRAYLDQIRITTGVARYTGPFVPPTKPFATSATASELVLKSDFATFTTTSPVLNLTHAGAVILLDGTSNAVTATLPTAASASGLTYIFNCINSANTITVDGNGAETIDGAANFTLTAGQYRRITSNGTAWYSTG